MKRKYIISFIVLLLFLLLPNILGLIVARDVTGFGMNLMYLLATVAFYLLGLTVFKQRTFFYVYSPLLLFNAVELVYQILNQATTSLLFIYTIVKAEHGEFMELLMTYWPILFIFIPAWILYFYLNHKFLPKDYLIKNKTIRISLLSLIVIFFAVSAIVLSSSNHKDKPVSDAWQGVVKACPINLAVQSVQLASIWDDMNGEAQSRLDDFHFGIQKKTDEEPEILLLLIGETSRYYNWSINGYERPTSPLIEQQKNLVSYDSCFTIANLTAVSVKYMLSRATPHDIELASKEKSLPEAFQEAGYSTAWIADQSFMNSYLNRIAYTCDYLYYHPHEELQRKYLDTVLLAPLQQYIATEENPKKFIVIHSLGSHFKYSSRYPEEYCKYKPDMKTIEWVQLFDSAQLKNENIAATVTNPTVINELREVIVNSYDNAIGFVDYFINEVIETLKQTGKPAALVYVGDHGENLLDDERNMMLHGTFSGSKYEWHVPMFVWTSDEYNNLPPQKVQAIRDNKNKHISTMNIFHSFINMANLDYPLLEENKCIDSYQLQADTVRWGLDANLKLTILED